MGAFADQVGAFARETEERMTAVWRDAVQRTVSSMQQSVGEGGNLPIDTGFLRNSIAANKGTTPMAGLRRNPGGSFSYDASDINLTILSSTPQEGLSVVYTAEYAIYVEMGARGRSPRGFVRLAAQRWPEFVRRANNALENRVNGQAG